MVASPSSRKFVPPPDWLQGDFVEDPDLGTPFLLMVTALAALLRFYDLTGPSLWVDEIMSWQTIRPGGGLNFLEQITDAIQGPLYLALTWPLLRIQDSALMLRLVPAVAGILTVPFFALTVRKLFDTRTARLAALLLAINPFHVWYSQEGRGYSLLMLFAVLMGYLLLEMTARRSDWKTAMLFALVAAGATWSNMSGLFLLVAMGLTVAIWHFPRTGGQWGMWSLAFGGALLLVVPWVLKAAGIWAVDRVVLGAATGEALRGETTFTPLALPYSLFTYFYGYSLGPSLRELHALDKWGVLRPWLPLLVAAAAPLGMGLLASVVRWTRRHGSLLLWILVPVAILIFLAVRNVKPWNPRYVAVILPWLLALVAWGLARLPRLAGGLLTLLLVGLTLFSLGGYYWNGRYAKADVRQLARTIQTLESSGTGEPAAVLVPVVAGVFQYYDQGRSEALSTFNLEPLRGPAGVEAFLDSTLAGRDRLYWLEARPWFFDPEGRLGPALARRGHLRLVEEADGARLYSWQRPATIKAEHGD